MNIPRVRLGVPVKQAIEVLDGADTADNYYVVKLSFTVFSTKDGTPYQKSIYHLLTTKEISEAIERYYSDADVCVNSGTKAVIGFAHPVTYVNRNNVTTTRILCRIDCANIEEFSDGVCCCLFSPRVIKRSRERYEAMTNHLGSIFTRFWKGFKKCLRLGK